LEQIEAIARSPLLAQMHTLDLDGNHLSDRGLAILLTSPHLQQLHTLNLANNYLSEAGFYDLLDARLPKLRWLDFRTNLLGQVSAGLFPELRPEDWPFAADLDGNAEVGHLGATPPGMLVNSLGMRFVPIPAGFDRTGQPVGPFWMGVYPVTLGDYDAVFREFEDGAGLRLPMEDVAYRKGEELCSELTQFNEERATGRIYDLPSVNEWQYACAADTTTAYGFGPAAGEDDLHCGSDFPLPVGRYPPNAWGLYDMHGTIEELCRQTEPPGVALCGGSYRSSEDECQTLSVRAWSAEESAYGVGFRVVLRQPPPSG
jgi:hypothetical protein